MKCYKCGADTDYATMTISDDYTVKNQILGVCKHECNSKNTEKDKTFTITCNVCGSKVKITNNNESWFEDIYIDDWGGGELYLVCDCGNKVAKY